MSILSAIAIGAIGKFIYDVTGWTVEQAKGIYEKKKEIWAKQRKEAYAARCKALDEFLEKNGFVEPRDKKESPAHNPAPTVQMPSHTHTVEMPPSKDYDPTREMKQGGLGFDCQGRPKPVLQEMGEMAGKKSTRINKFYPIEETPSIPPFGDKARTCPKCGALCNRFVFAGYTQKFLGCEHCFDTRRAFDISDESKMRVPSSWNLRGLTSEDEHSKPDPEKTATHSDAEIRNVAKAAMRTRSTVSTDAMAAAMRAMAGVSPTEAPNFEQQLMKLMQENPDAKIVTVSPRKYAGAFDHTPSHDCSLREHYHTPGHWGKTHDSLHIDEVRIDEVAMGIDGDVIFKAAATDAAEQATRAGCVLEYAGTPYHKIEWQKAIVITLK